MNQKLIVSAAVVLLLALAGLGGYWVIGDADLRRAGSGVRPAGGATPAESTGGGLSPAEVGAIQANLDRLQVSQQVRAGLSGGVDQPWAEARALEAFQSCMSRLEGGGIVEATAPDTHERVCSCVTRGLQRSYPGAPPKASSPRVARELSRAELAAIEECTGQGQ